MLFSFFTFIQFLLFSYSNPVYVLWGITCFGSLPKLSRHSSPTYSFPLLSPRSPYCPCLCISSASLSYSKMNSHVYFSLDQRLYTSIRHLAFRAQFLFADCVSSLSLALHLGFICFKPSEFSVRASIFPTSYRQPSGLSPLFYRSTSLHRAKPCVRRNASHSRQIALDFRCRAGRRGMGMGGTKNVDPMGQKAVERDTSEESLVRRKMPRLHRPRLITCFILHRHTWLFSLCRFGRHNKHMGCLGGK